MSLIKMLLFRYSFIMCKVVGGVRACALVRCLARLCVYACVVWYGNEATAESYDCRTPTPCSFAFKKSELLHCKDASLSCAHCNLLREPRNLRAPSHLQVPERYRGRSNLGAAGCWLEWILQLPPSGIQLFATCRAVSYTARVRVCRTPYACRVNCCTTY